MVEVDVAINGIHYTNIDWNDDSASS